MPLVSALLFILGAAHANNQARIRGASQVVWTGIDYTLAQYISTTDFRDEQKVAQYYPAQWNNLVLQELTEEMAMDLNKTVVTDTNFMFQHNQACTTDQVIRQEGGTPSLTADQVAQAVASWTPIESDGLGMGVVAERFVKLDEQGCAWLVFYELSDKHVLYSEHFCEQAAGFGFRNFWFRPIKSVLTRELGPTMKQIKRQAR